MHAFNHTSYDPAVSFTRSSFLAIAKRRTILCDSLDTHNSVFVMRNFHTAVISPYCSFHATTGSQIIHSTVLLSIRFAVASTPCLLPWAERRREASADHAVAIHTLHHRWRYFPARPRPRCWVKEGGVGRRHLPLECSPTLIFISFS